MSPLRELPGDPFDALGDANRRAIVELLRAGDRSVRELADALPISRPAVSRHLRLLKEAGLVSDRAGGHAPALPPPRRGDRGRARVPRAGVGRRGRAVPARRGEHARALMEPLSARLHRRLLARARVRRVGDAGRRCGGRTGTPSPAIRGSASRSSRGPAAASTSARRRARSTTGARCSRGSRRAGSPTSGTCARTSTTRRASRSRFAAEGDGTRVSIVHAGWERLGDRAAPLRDRNRTGWAGLVPHYVRAAEAG